MPLTHSKSKKAFSKNVETEMEAGKPQKQSLAIAYSVKRKAPKKKMAQGGKAEEKGVHQDRSDWGANGKGISGAGQKVREGDKFGAMVDHSEKLEQLKSMKKPKLMARGGEVSDDELEQDNAPAHKQMAEIKKSPTFSVTSAKDEKRPMPEDKYNDRQDASRVKGSNGSPVQWTGDSGRKDAGEGSHPGKMRIPGPKDAQMRTMDSEESDLESSDSPDGEPQPRTWRNEMRPMGSLPGERDTSKPHSIAQKIRRMAEGGAILKELYDDEAHMQSKLPASGPHDQQPKKSYDELDPMGEIPGEMDHEKPHSKNIPQLRMAHGGMASKPMSITDAIMSKRRADNMADGGMVDLEENSEEMPNYYDELNERAADEPQYDDSQISKQPADSNEHGDVLEDEDSHDMVGRIRARMKTRRGF